MEGYRCLKGEKHPIGEKCTKWKCPYLKYKGKQIFLFYEHDRYQAKRITKIQWDEGKCIFQNIEKLFRFIDHSRIKEEE